MVFGRVKDSAEDTGLGLGGLGHSCWKNREVTINKTAFSVKSAFLKMA